jgi:uncharacterized lipoprotein
MLKPATLLAFLCVLAACSPDSREEAQTTGERGVESAPPESSSALPADQTAPIISPNPAAEDATPPDSNTTLPAATPEEAAPPPEP